MGKPRIRQGRKQELPILQVTPGARLSAAPLVSIFTRVGRQPPAPYG
jgi:hypothetical protein